MSEGKLRLESTGASFAFLDLALVYADRQLKLIYSAPGTLVRFYELASSSCSVNHYPLIQLMVVLGFF